MNDRTNIEQLLGSDEHLLWSGKPVQRIFLGPWDVVLSLFDIFWLSVTAYVIYHALKVGAST